MTSAGRRNASRSATTACTGAATTTTAAGAGTVWRAHPPSDQNTAQHSVTTPNRQCCAAISDDAIGEFTRAPHEGSTPAAHPAPADTDAQLHTNSSVNLDAIEHPSVTLV